MLAKKAKCRKAANSASSGAKRRFPIESKKFFPADVLCAFANTHARASTRKNCLYGNEPGGNRTHDLLLRRDAHRFPSRELHCPVMPDFPAFPADFYVFDGGQRNVKNRTFQPCCQTSVRYANKGGSPLRQRRNLLDENAYIIITKQK